MAAKVVAVMNMKGGVGKTTLTFNLASYLAEFKAMKVLLVDLDPQANATLVSTDPTKYQEHLKNRLTISHAFMHCYRAYGPVQQKPAQPPQFDSYKYEAYSNVAGGRFDLIPSDLRLSSMLKSMNFGPFDLDTLLTAEVRGAYDFVLIDCAPTYSSLTTIAFNSAKAVLIPMLADSFGLFGTTLMLSALDEHNDDFGFKPRVIGVVFTLWRDTATQLHNSNEIIKNWPTDAVFPARISHNDWYKVANGKRQQIWDTPASQAVKNEFTGFVDQFLVRA